MRADYPRINQKHLIEHTMGTDTVLLVSNTAWSLYKFRLKLIQSLVTKGYKVALLAAEDEYASLLTQVGAAFFPLKHMNGKSRNPFTEVKLMLELLHCYRRIQPSLIFQYTIKPNIYGTFIAKLLKVPCICVVTGLGYTFIQRGLIPTLAKKLYRVSLKGATEVWFLNQDDKDLFIQYNLVNENKTSILLGEGIDCNYFDPGKLPLPPKDSSKTRFLLLARLLYDKGIREYAEAAQLVKSRRDNVDFNLIGYLNVQNPSAVTEEELNQWVRMGYVNYLGSISDVRQAVLEHDCVVLPSYREGMSMVLMESAALGTPLIATNIPGCKEIIEDGVTGFVCNVRDASDLADKIEAFLSLSSVQRKEMGDKGRQKMIEEFDVQNIIASYLSVAKKYVGHPHPSM